MSTKTIKAFVRDVVAGVAYHGGITRLFTKGKFAIVTFHRVLTEAQLKEYPFRPLAVSRDEFSWLVSFFQEEFTCGTLEETLQRYNSNKLSKKPLLAITFDDGQRDNYLNALPILERNNLKATFFIAIDGVNNRNNLWHDNVGYAVFNLLRTNKNMLSELLNNYNLQVNLSSNDLVYYIVNKLKDFSDERRLEFEERLLAMNESRFCPSWDGLMDWEQIKSLKEKGHEIGSHTFSHPILTKCTDEKLEKEITRSKMTLEEKLGYPIHSFCYPNGDYSEKIMKIVESAGYSHAVTTNWGLNKGTMNPFELNRCDIQSRTSVSRNGILSKSRLALRISGLQPGL